MADIQSPKVHKFTLRMKHKNKIQKMYMVSGDSNSDLLVISLEDSKDGSKVEPFVLQENSIVTVVFLKEDGNVVTGQAEISGVNEIQYLVKGNEIAFPGKVEAQVQVYGADSRLSSWDFSFNVKESLDDGDAIESTTEYSVLTSLITDVEQINAAEALRVTAEQDRVIAAQNHAIEEQIRKSSETSRETTFGTMVQDFNIVKQGAISATEGAVTATTNANNATGSVNSAIQTANTAASNANTKAQLAETKATLADDKATFAGQKAQEAIEAAQTANNAAINVKDGLSAYEVWISQGNTGTESDYFASLKGNPGIVYQPEEPTDPDTFVWISDEDSPVLDPETLALKQDLDALQDEVSQHKNDYATYVARTDPFAIYGVSWDKSSNPTLTRTDSAVGFIANAGVDDETVQNDFDKTQIFGEIYDVEDSLGNIFVRIPKFYIRKTDSPTLKTWQISKTKYKGFYLPWCFWDFEKGRELPYIDIGKYKASLNIDNKLESKPNTAPLVSRNIVQFRDYAQANNTGGLLGYQQLDVHVYDVIQTLFYVEFATLHSQSIMQGFTAGRYGTETELATVSETDTNRIIVSDATAAQYRVGQTISAGTARYGTQVFYGRTIMAIEDYDANNKAIIFDGAPVNIEVGNLLQNTGAVSGFSSKILASSGSIGNNHDGKYPCMYRGIESPYGDIYQFVDGINVNDFQAWVALNANDYASNVFASPYKELGYLNAPAGGYIKEMGFDSRYPFAEFPIEIGAGASTYYADYYYQNTGQRLALVGGGWSVGATAGLSFWYLYYASSAAAVAIGGRLLRKPL